MTFKLAGGIRIFSYLQQHAAAMIALAVGFSALPLAAQQPATPTPYPPPFPDPLTCPIKVGIKSFILEDRLFPTSFQTIFIPTISPQLLAAFSDPTKQVRTHFTFDTTTMLFEAWSIPVPLDAPLIAPSNTDFAGMAVAHAEAKIDKVYAVCYPRPTIMVTGPITSNTTPVLGDLTGAPHGFSFSWDPTKDGTMVENAANVAIVDGGANTVVSLTGSVIVVPATTVAVITGAPVINTMYREIVLDGTQSATSNGRMSYQWSVKDGVDVAILDPESPQTRIRIHGLAGDYPVTLSIITPYETVSSTVTVHYDPRL